MPFLRIFSQVVVSSSISTAIFICIHKFIAVRYFCVKFHVEIRSVAYCIDCLVVSMEN